MNLRQALANLLDAIDPPTLTWRRRIQKLAEQDPDGEGAVPLALLARGLVDEDGDVMTRGHTHDDRYYTEDEVDALIAAGGGGGSGAINQTGGAEGYDNPAKLKSLQRAANETVRIFYGGTSIQNSNNAAGRHWLQALMQRYGDSGNRNYIAANAGGSSTAPVSGWKVQVYGGLTFRRFRGESTSSDMTHHVWCRQFVLRYSKEADGGSWDVYVDDVYNATVNSSGAQSYNNELVINFPTLGYHKITLKPPTTGYAYFEGFSQNVNNPGIDITDGSLGGSAVVHMYNYATGTNGGVTAEAVQLNPPHSLASPNFRSVDSYMLNTSATGNYDVIFFAWVVNDAINDSAFQTYYKPTIERLVEHCRTYGKDLILLLETGGHFGVATDSAHDAFLQIREKLLSYASEPFVTIIDDHAFTIPPDPDASLAEWQTYAAKYYPAATITSVSPTLAYTGDFIHPSADAHLGATAKLCAVSGIPAIGMAGDSYLKAESRSLLDRNRPYTLAPTSALVPTGTGVTLEMLDNRGDRHAVRAIGESVRGLFFPRVSETLWASDTMVNLMSAANTTIAAESTSDEFGKYKLGAWSISGGSGYPVGTRVTVCVVVGPGSFNLALSNSTGSTQLSQRINGKDYGVFQMTGTNGSKKPITVHFTGTLIDSGFRVSVISTDVKVYAMYATFTDVPVIAYRSEAEVRTGSQMLPWTERFTQYIDLSSHAPAPVVTGTGSGAATSGTPYMDFATGTTAGSTARVQTGLIHSNTNSSQVGSGAHSGFNWAEPVEFTVRGANSQVTTNGVVRFQIKAATTIGTLAGIGMGIEIRNLFLYITVHNGTTLTTYSTGTQINIANRTFALTLRSDGQGNALLYNRGVLIGRTTGAPTTVTNAGENRFAVEVENGADAANVSLRLQRNVQIIGG